MDIDDKHRVLEHKRLNQLEESRLPEWQRPTKKFKSRGASEQPEQLKSTVPSEWQKPTAPSEWSEFPS